MANAHKNHSTASCSLHKFRYDYWCSKVSQCVVPHHPVISLPAPPKKKTPLKSNSSPLKNSAWMPILSLFGAQSTISGATLNFGTLGGCIYPTTSWNQDILVVFVTPNSVLTSVTTTPNRNPPSTLILKTRQAAAFARLHLEKHGDMPKIWWKIYSMEKPFNGKKDMRKKRSIFFREIWKLEVVRMIPSKTLQSKSSGFMWPYEGCRVQSLLKCLLATFISDHLDILGTTLTSDTPEVNSSPLKSYDPKRRVTFQPLFFRSYVKLPGSTSFKLPSDSKPLTTSWHQAIVAS